MNIQISNKRKTKVLQKISRRPNVYMDYAATTPVDDRVINAMLPYFNKIFANPSSLHSPGQAALAAVRDSRQKIAASLNAHEDEIVFTSGGTSSDNLAIYGVLDGARAKLKSMATEDAIPHVVTSAIEHDAVLEPLLFLEKAGIINLTVVKPQIDGIVRTQDIVQAIKSDTVLVSIMYANNEIGTIQPIPEIGREILKWRKNQNTIFPYFHSDACQAAGYFDLNVEKLHTDLLTLNGGKIYGPKGIGILFVRRGVLIKPMIRGGGQERGLRSGTENVPAIVGLAKALELAQADQERETARLTVLRDRLIDGLLKIPKTRLNGDAKKRLPQV